MKKIIFLTIGLLFTFSVFAATDSMKTKGDKAYAQSNYVEAIRIYESVLQKGESAEVYYNLGNCYYKHNEMAKAILNYERALLLKPYDSDVRSNLEIARSKTLDKVDPTPDIFFVTWIKALINLLSVDKWAKLGILFFVLFLGFVSLYIFSQRIFLKKIGFVCGLVFVAFTVLSNVFAYKQKNDLVKRDGAIIMSHSVIVRSTPNDNGTKLFEIHEGRKVSVADDTIIDWKEIQLEDGKVGWVHASDIAVI